MEPLTLKTAVSTPASSPGLFSPITSTSQRPQPPSLPDGTPQNSPYLHPLQMHKVRETHKAEVDKDFITGRKLINQYEIIDEIGRGVYGKVKLARSLETGGYVAIKIIQRFSKRRRLGHITVAPEDKTKREIAILKKIRHPNVVGLLEVIDDPELKKIYMVLEHVELGEVVWRKKGLPQICRFDRLRVEREKTGEVDTGEEEQFFKQEERRRQLRQSKLAHIQSQQQGHGDYWSLEHGDDDNYSEGAPLSRQVTTNSERSIAGSYRALIHSNHGSRNHSRATSRAPSRTSSRAHTPLPEHDIPALDSDNEDDTPGPLPSISAHGSASALTGTMYGPYADYPDHSHRGRAPSAADSIVSHMSSIEAHEYDPFEDDYSYVPCFTMDQARSAFRDTVLGLEYLHYEGIVHRDIKPANLLWTKDHRVKISDFGVSYFGRPIRPGETEEDISEADATDFDDDLELAKTVGTPAFFAPELCYTDLDAAEQPKVTEQIDVWSLGVTLYCLIFARLPFLAERDVELFRAIAKNDVYIPKKRLKAVDPSDKRIGPSTDLNIREDGELTFEDIDTDLRDLLKRMLIKDPVERIKLREVKRHPWVLIGIDNILGWIDDTDPSRKTAGRRIQVDRSELDHAVIPITFLERARSALKKTVSKVISVTRSDRTEGSRRRAISSATSSGTDNLHTPLTPSMRDIRRASLRGDESYFASTSELQEQREPTEHPLAQSLSASPDLSLDGVDPFSLDFKQPSTVGETPKHDDGSGQASDFDSRPALPDRMISTSESINTIVPRGHSHSKSVTYTPTGVVSEEGPNKPGPFTDHHGNIFGGHLWRGRDYMNEIEESPSRARSVDRGVFNSENKHAEASVATSKAIAPGHFEHSTPLHHPRPTRSAETSPTNSDYNRPLPSPLFFQPYMVQQHQILQSSSTPNVPQSAFAASSIDERPATANRTPEVKTPAPRVYGISTPESFARAQKEQDRKKKLEAEAEANKLKELAASQTIQPPRLTDCPPSPDDHIFHRKQEESQRAQSSSSVGSNYIRSQVTSPLDLISPTSSSNLGSQEQFFASVPSLPALVSSGSSVCADPEGDFLQHPGVVPQPQAVLSSSDTPGTLTPPSLSKETSHDQTTPTGTIAVDADDDGYNADGDTMMTVEDSDSDSDEGLTMTRRKPAARVTMPRRGTNASVGSTDTAKKVDMDN